MPQHYPEWFRDAVFYQIWPASFKDATGERWHVPVTVGTLMSIKDELELNLLDESDKMPQDVEGVLSIIWLCVKSQAKDKGLSLDDFAELLDGESINAACEAWMQGYVDFFCHLQPPQSTSDAPPTSRIRQKSSNHAPVAPNDTPVHDNLSKKLLRCR